MLALAMKKIGADVTFIINYPKDYSLFRPEHRYSDINYPYPDWIIEVKPYSNKKSFFPNIMMKKEIDILNKADLVVLNDSGHRIRPYLKKKIKSFSLLTGSDIDLLCDFNKILKISCQKSDTRLTRLLKKMLHKKLTKDQRKGIEMAHLVNYFPEGINNQADQILNEILKDKNTRFFFMMSNTERIKYCKARENKKIRIFNATRFLWHEPLPKTYSSYENKRNDIMIKGIGQFLKITNYKLDIHFVEKGADIDFTKNLIKKEGFTNLVTWHQEMSQKKVLEQYIACDIMFEQLGKNIIGMAGLDAMAVGRPVIGNARPNIIEPLIGRKSPVCQAETAEEVCRWLEKLVFNRELRMKIGLESRKYVEEHFSPTTAAFRISKKLGFEY